VPLDTTANRCHLGAAVNLGENMGRRRIRLARAAAGLIAAIAFVAALPSAAVGSSKQEVTVSVVGLEVISQRTVTERGANTAVVNWHFEVLNLSSSEPSICCDMGLDPLTWVWNTKTGAGNISATWNSHHFFLPIRWEGRLSGRVSASGGAGILHMSEVNSGVTFHGKWTSLPVDPLGEGFAGTQGWSIDVIGTVG
jgi:hypothetical protein